jgi:DNA-binding NarL/FixJ family response regulator
MSPAGVLIVDDHPVVRQGLRTMLSAVPSLSVVGEAGSGAAALRAVTGPAPPDVVLLDLRMPGADGVQVARQIRRRAPAVRILILTMHQDPAQAARALEAGADGYLLKSSRLEQLADAIRRALAGERVLAPELAAPLLDDYAALLRDRTRDTADLSEEELSILDGVAHGRSYRELAVALHMSEITVRRRVQDVYRKLDVGDRAHAVAVAIRRGLM